MAKASVADPPEARPCRTFFSLRGGERQRRTLSGSRLRRAAPAPCSTLPRPAPRTVLLPDADLLSARHSPHRDFRRLTYRGLLESQRQAAPLRASSPPTVFVLHLWRFVCRGLRSPFVEVVVSIRDAVGYETFLPSLLLLGPTAGSSHSVTAPRVRSGAATKSGEPRHSLVPSRSARPAAGPLQRTPGGLFGPAGPVAHAP